MELVDGVTISISGKVEDSILKLIRIIGEEEVKFNLPLTSSTDILFNNFFPVFFIKDLEVGNRFKWNILNPITQTKKSIVAYVERSTLLYYKNKFETVYVVNLQYQAVDFELWINREGKPLKVTTPWGWTFISV